MDKWKPTEGPIKNQDIIRTHAEELMGFCQKRFGFKRPPNILFATDQNNYHNLYGKTGYYDPQKEEIVIYITGRHPKDILRSLAHELVHHTQNLSGELATGYFGPGYAQSNKKARDNEEDAYSRGNLAFRDFEDEKKKILKGDMTMIESKLASAVKRLVEKKIKELRVEAPSVSDSKEVLEEEGSDCHAVHEGQEHVDFCEANPDDKHCQSDSDSLVHEELTDEVNESKIITPEQEEEFHNSIFGTRLVALNAKLMSNFIKK